MRERRGGGVGGDCRGERDDTMVRRGKEGILEAISQDRCHGIGQLLMRSQFIYTQELIMQVLKVNCESSNGAHIPIAYAFLKDKIMRYRI